MNNKVLPFVMALCVLGIFVIIFLGLTGSKEHSEPLLSGETAKVTTASSTGDIEQPERLVSKISFPVINWTQKQEYGQFADYAEVIISDLRPFTDKQLTLTLSNWSQEPGNPEASAGVMWFDRATGDLTFDPQETAEEIATGVLYSSSTLISFHDKESTTDIDTALRLISIEEMILINERYSFYSKDEMLEYKNDINKYCTAKSGESAAGVSEYLFLETDEYKKIPEEIRFDKGFFYPCGVGTYYVSDDFIAKKHYIRRQDGVAIDKLLFQ